jgi:hypothetical protein
LCLAKTQFICIFNNSARHSPNHEHDPDYFHGVIYVSPRGAYIADDGWVWRPSGIPSVWSLDRWLSHNVWESEDGPTRINLCARAYYWEEAATWIDERFIAIGGIGEDDSWCRSLEGVEEFRSFIDSSPSIIAVGRATPSKAQLEYGVAG